MSQTEFPQLIEQWKRMDPSTPEAVAFYDEQVFPLVKQRFVENPSNHPEREYYGLILPVGTSPEPLILSILAIQPQKVAFLYTEQTEQYLDRIGRETGIGFGQAFPRQIDGGDVTEMYKVIMGIYKTWGRRSNIAIDITGGKKSMVSGAAMAGAFLGADIYYIDNKRFLHDFRKPDPGSEFLSRLENPYKVFGDLEVDKAAGFYEKLDFTSAQSTFEVLREKVSEPNQETVYRAYALLCAVYEAWDQLNFNKAIKDLNDFIELLNKFSTLDGLDVFRKHQPHLESQRQTLVRLRDMSKDETRALSNPEGFHFAFMLLTNVRRRERQRKFDVAALLLYRLLEWIGQYRLAQRGISTSEPDYSKIAEEDVDGLAQRFNQKRQSVLHRQDTVPLPDKIALLNAFILLDVIGDEMTTKIDWSRFVSQIELRNKSIYAHGFKMISGNQYNAFKKTVTELFNQAVSLADIDAAEFEKQHRFISKLPVG